MSEFHGVIVAAVTPRARQGDVDFGAAFELIDHCCRGGAGGILLFGEEGEYLAFTYEERSRLAYLAVKRSRVPVFVGAGSATFDASVTLAREAFDAGAEAVLLPPPCFYRYQPDELEEFYFQFAGQMYPGTSLMLYNTPGSTSEIPVETAIRLIDSGAYSGINDASGDPAYFACLRAGAETRSFDLLCGSDALFGECEAMVSGAACALPEVAAGLAAALRSGNHAEAARLRAALDEFRDRALQFPPTVAVKTALEVRRLKTGPIQIPLSPQKQALLEEFRAWFTAWLPQFRKIPANV